MNAETALRETKASLDEALMKSEQLEHQLIALQMKQNVAKEELEKEKGMLKRSTDILARQKEELEVSVCALHIDCTWLPHPQAHEFFEETPLQFGMYACVLNMSSACMYVMQVGHVSIELGNQ